METCFLLMLCVWMTTTPRLPWFYDVFGITCCWMIILNVAMATTFSICRKFKDKKTLHHRNNNSYEAWLWEHRNSIVWFVSHFASTEMADLSQILNAKKGLRTKLACNFKARRICETRAFARLRLKTAGQLKKKMFGYYRPIVHAVHAICLII